MSLPRAALAAESSDQGDRTTLAYAAAVAERRGLGPARRPTPADAFDAARRAFLAGERLDMQALAAELGVSRKTLYRWTGDRERLLADVMSEIAVQNVEDAKRHATGTGAERITMVVERVLRNVASAFFLRRFFENDPGLALRIVTSRDAGVQTRLVEAVANLIREEEDSGAFRSAVDAETLAYAMVRLMEAFVYNDTLTGLEPHLDKALSVIPLLLR